MPRGLVYGEDPVNVASKLNRGLVAYEEPRKRFIREREITLRTFWAPVPVSVVVAFTIYPYQGGGYYPA